MYTRTLPTTAGQAVRPQIREFMSITGTLPSTSRSASADGGSASKTLLLGQEQTCSSDRCWAMQSGAACPVVIGVSWMSMTPMPCRYSPCQEAALPAPTSALACGPETGWVSDPVPASSEVITTSGLIVVTSSCVTAVPHWKQDGYATWSTGLASWTSAQAQVACNSVISSQCS